MQQFSAVVVDVASTVGATQYSEVVNASAYKSAIIQAYSPDTGDGQLQVTSVDGDVAGTPEDTSWYAIGALVSVSGGWAVGTILPICAKYLRVAWAGTAGDEVKVVLTLQG